MPNVREIKAKAEAKAGELRKTLAKLEKLTGQDSLRDRDAERKRLQRAAGKNVIVPKCEDRARREQLEADDVAWLMHYFGRDSEVEDPFWYQFTDQQIEMIQAIRNAIRDGGDQALGASRGEGKTTLFERLLVKYTLQGVLSFSVLCASTGPMADNSLDTIKTAFEENPLLLADYPEVCVPVRALENTPSRAHYQTVSGDRHDNGQPYEMAGSRFTWCGQEIIFPRVPGSPSARAIIATRGLDAAVRGLKRKGRRPQLVGIDDPDTEETARSEIQGKKLEDRIERALAGLGSQQRPVARVMLTTLQNRTCVSFRFTDPKLKPSWHGKRFRFLIKPPDRLDLWDQYIESLQTDWQQGTTTAHDLYVANREAMDAGSVVANPNRHTPAELSALQHYYNQVARLGPEAVATEYDNDPAEEESPQESGITDALVRNRLNKRPKGILPLGTLALTAFIDVGDHVCHWSVKAWLEGCTGFVIDHGVEEVYSDGKDSPGIDKAIVNALHRWRQRMLTAPYVDEKGNPRAFDLVPIDAGYRDTAVYQFVKEVGGKPFQASKGFGEGRMYASTFNAPAKNTPTRKAGNHWYLSKQQKHGVWLLCMDADYWKRFAHERFLTPTFNDDLSVRRGSLSLWGDDPKDHFNFAKHIVAEVEREEFITGKGVRRVWHRKNPNNHWLDTTYGNCAAADVCGVHLFAAPPAATNGASGSTSWFASQRRR